MCRFYDVILYTEYFNKRGLYYKDLFYRYNRFENIPMIFYLVMIIIDGFLYYGIEILISEINFINLLKFLWKKTRPVGRNVSYSYVI